MLTDGEGTEIGANGINLSGGQRWRVTFARALYSRAGILVLDDIFSAVDAHVGRHIFEKGLTGELGQGRTRILVTHHVALCKSKTKYIVELGDGTVENSGFVQELEEAGTLQQIISHEETERQVEEDEDPTAVNSEESSDIDQTETLKKVESKKAAPKKFIEEESRERGRVKTRVYLDYLKSSGGIPFWGFALVFFTAQQCFITGESRKFYSFILADTSQAALGGFVYGQAPTSTQVSNKLSRNLSRSKDFTRTDATPRSPSRLPLSRLPTHQRTSNSTLASTLPCRSPSLSLERFATGTFSLVPFALLVVSSKD